MKVNNINNNYGVGYMNNVNKSRVKDGSTKINKFDIVLFSKSSDKDEVASHPLAGISKATAAEVAKTSDAANVEKIDELVNNGKYEVNSTELARILLSI